MAFHSGALAALEDTTGWDPRKAELIVGTSAGSVAGSMLRLGVSTADQIARVSGGEPSAATQALFAKVGATGPPSFPTFSPPRTLAPVDPQALARALTRRGRQRRVALLAAAIPEGIVDTSETRSMLGQLFDDFPDGLWVCAVRVSDGELVVFGRDDIEATVAEAVGASTAIPGFFKPVTIDGEKYVDGGLRSMANADLAAGQGLDVVVVSSPMTFAPVAPGAVGAALSGPLRQRLRRELRKLRADGTPVLVLEPDRNLRLTMGANPMNPERRADVMLATRDAVAKTLRSLDLSKFPLA